MLEAGKREHLDSSYRDAVARRTQQRAQIAHATRSIDLVSQQVRFIVRIDPNWRVAFTCEADPSWHAGDRTLNKLDDGSGGHFPAPVATLHKPGEPHDTPGPAPDVAEIARRYEAILARTVDRDTIEIFGHYLFDVLLGPELWADMQQKTEALGARHLELALAWPDDRDLHRLNWELMRSDDQFLAAGTAKLAVAITRRIETDAVQGAPQLNVPPRVLFVVGTSLADEEIRPGAELHGLLKQARASRAMSYRVLERASPQVLRQVVRAFKPEVVHFICHGGVDADGVYLDLQTDERDADTRRYARQLLFDLRFGDSFPTIVVLSACLTAGTPGAERYVLAGGHETAPMAATLVKGGIPIVLGMAGRIADITCRLFARTFAEAVVKGEPLVIATSEARQIAFADGRNPLTSADWAFPAIFMAGGVPAGYAPVRQRESEELWQTIESWVAHYGLASLDPVFCGREDFLRRFHALFETPRALDERPGEPDTGRVTKRVLAAIVDTPEKGYGRTRLLQELAAQAFRDGHLPVLLTFDTEDCPRDLGAFVREFERAIARVRNDVLGLGEPLESQLSLVADPQDAPGVEPAIGAELRRAQGQLTARVVKLAIRADLAKLLADARARYPLYAALPSQVVVLLDDVDQYGPLVADLLKQGNGILDTSGLGSPDQPVPVVMTCSLGLDATDKILRPIAEQRTRPGWLETASLGRFAENGEDLLACELVLLHPFADDLLPGVSGIGWAFNDDVEPEVRARWEGRFRRAVKGIPINFLSQYFYSVAETAGDQDFTIEADDETLLAKLTRPE